MWNEFVVGPSLLQSQSSSLRWQHMRRCCCGCPQWSCSELRKSHAFFSASTHRSRRIDCVCVPYACAYACVCLSVCVHWLFATHCGSCDRNQPTTTITTTERTMRPHCFCLAALRTRMEIEKRERERGKNKNY